MAAEPGNDDPGDATSEGENQVFREQLAEQAETSSSESGTECDFCRAVAKSSQQKIGDVYAGDEKDETHSG
jgi:hypothetical protein